jgi:hypothetical protein
MSGSVSSLELSSSYMAAAGEASSATARITDSSSRTSATVAEARGRLRETTATQLTRPYGNKLPEHVRSVRRRSRDEPVWSAVFAADRLTSEHNEALRSQTIQEEDNLCKPGETPDQALDRLLAEQADRRLKRRSEPGYGSSDDTDIVNIAHRAVRGLNSIANKQSAQSWPTHRLMKH